MGIKGKKEPFIPAGILYFKLDDPIIKTDGKDSTEKVEEKLIKEMKMRGLILADKEVITQMDKTINGDSLIIPVSIKKDGSLGQRSSAATLEQFELLKEHVKRTLIKLCHQMFSGNISISPYKRKKYISCSYCPYSSICRFEKGINRYRHIGDMKDEEVWKALNNAKEDEGGENVG